MKQKKYVFFTVSILLSLILSIQVYAVGDGNLDGGGGSMGQGTIQNSWSPGNEGVRVTVIRAESHDPVTRPIDLTNKHPYVWGGSSPDTSFDCSGYICWVYTRSGVYHLSRTTAQGIYDQCAIVSREEARPGDLVFFTGTYASAGAVSHVGIYVGGSRMLHCGSPIGYADLTSPYWNSHLYAFGRLATIPE